MSLIFIILLVAITSFVVGYLFAKRPQRKLPVIGNPVIDTPYDKEIDKLYSTGMERYKEYKRRLRAK